MQTGLVLPIPEAQAVVGRIRSRHDPAARAGMPPHVTLIYPFMDSKAFDAEAKARLLAVCAGTGLLELTFQRLGSFDDVLWLAPEPAEPVIRLTHRLTEAFPDFPPYGGAFDEVTPHLTVAHGDAGVFGKLSARLEPALRDPVRSRVEHVALFGLSPVGWIEIERFALAG